LNLHEFQSKQLMDKYGVATQRWRVASNVEDAKVAADELINTGAEELVVKAQVHAGGRGKGTFENGFKGGVHLVKDSNTAVDYAGKMLNNRLITKQTGDQGALVNSVMIAESLNFSREYYFALLMDRAHNGPVMVASPCGGMDIEEVAESTPEKIFVEPVDINEGPKREQTLSLARRIGFDESVIPEAADQIERLYDLFINSDATQVEINPLVQTDDKKVFCIDAKINFDDNAEFRQKDIFAMHDSAEDDQREVEAAKAQLQYIGLDGNIGCLVNGAGLAMATMDIIKHYGGSPANFCDLGGGATEKRVTDAFRIVSSDPQVKVLLVNIFGGIVRCDVIARGVIAATQAIGLEIPLVVRLQGTNAVEAKELLKESGLRIETADSMDEAASMAVKALGN